jgi:starch synthase
MKVLLAASEVVGFAKTGGLADVVGSLPRALARRGHECAVILPLYNSARQATVAPRPTEHTFNIAIGGRTVTGRLWRSTLPGSTIPVYLIEQSAYFERDDPAQGRGLYQWTTPRGDKQDYPDNCERFVFFCRAVLETLRLLGFWPDVLHANDWQTGLLPVYLREEYGPRSSAERDEKPRAASSHYDRIRTLFTIHNIAYQGVFWHWDMNLTGLDWRLFNHELLEFYGHLSFLKAGIVFADLLNTVSPSYAKEIQTPYYGCGLHGVLSERHDRLFGIVNGVDYAEWDPATDPRLPANYDLDSVAVGKAVCKRALQNRYGLSEGPGTPLLGMVARLVEQKGIDLVLGAAGPLLEQGTQLVVLGEGNPAYHRGFLDLKARYPDQVGLTLSFDETLAHQIEAGVDLFLMPSLYEPSGLNQLYSMKYGSVPVVRATGGLADTVVDCTPETLAAGKATGFSFLARTPEALLETVQRALAFYRGQPDQWLRLLRNGMRQDWSWDRNAAEYERLYAKLQAPG